MKERVKFVRVTSRNPRLIIQVVGDRDPRGADNTVEIWVDKQDQLHIRVLKPNRCYRFKEMIDEGSYVEIVQD